MCLCDAAGSATFENADEDASVPFETTPRNFSTVESDTACATETTQAKPGEKIDIIFVIDNSGSMASEIAAVRSNINVNFASVIARSRVDFRVIMLSEFGVGGQSVCVEPPLAGAPCSEGLTRTSSTRFFHYSITMQSSDPWCRLLETFDQPDEAQLVPEGWGHLLRTDARKLFVIITDDSAGCTWAGPEGPIRFNRDNDPITDATTFHRALLARSPEQFGVPPDVRYSWYSIVGMPPNEPLSAPWFPHDPIDEAQCATATGAGAAYQALSIMTDALRYPVCEGLGFESVFRALSRGVIRTAKADCSFELPDAPEGEAIDVASIAIEYRASGGQSGGQGGQSGGQDTQRFERVATGEECTGDEFFLDGDKLRLCPSACAVVRADDNAAVDVLFGCGGGPT